MLEDKGGKETGVFYNPSKVPGHWGKAAIYSRCTSHSVFADRHFLMGSSNSLLMPVEEASISVFYRIPGIVSGNLGTEVRLAPMTLDSCQVLLPLNLTAEETAAPFAAPMVPKLQCTSVSPPSPPASEFTSLANNLISRGI